MKKYLSILLKTIITIGVEIVFFMIVLVVFTYGGDLLSKKIFINVRYFMICVLILFALYEVFANTKYRNISAILLRYRFNCKNKSILRISLSNLIFAIIYVGLLYSKIKEMNLIYQNIFTILFGIELGSCFVPKIGTRLSLFLCGVSWENIPKKEKKLKNDGVML